MACIYKINGKTFNTTEEIQNYVSSDEFVSVLAKGNLGISKEIRNLILNKDEKTTNEVREVEDGQREKGNEAVKSKGKNDGQKTNDVQNEEVTEGGVKAPQVKAGSVGVGGEVESIKKPIIILKGNRGKLNPDGTKRTAHPNVEGIFGSTDLKSAERYGEDISEFNIPIGTTIETVEVPVKGTQKEYRDKETELINNSNAQVVKLITFDAKGIKEEQYIIKDKNLLKQNKKTEGKVGQETPQAETSKPKPENVKAIEEAITKKSGTIKNEIIKEAADPTEVKKILDNLDSIKSKLAGLTTKDGDSVFSEECKWG